MEKEIAKRSEGKCELCGSTEALTIHVVSPKKGSSIEECAHICAVCDSQINGEVELDANHWRCLNDSMWSEVDSVKVISWRMLNSLKDEGWPNDLLEMMYLDEDAEKWAKDGVPSDDAVVHVDSNGVQLQPGDSVVLIKDLKVKGGNFTAKRGTAVRNITLVHDNAEHIEGKVEGQRIVILTQYVKK
ncbi:MAG: PhnA domain-containing protein [Crocinitomicaceae bacterium]